MDYTKVQTALNHVKDAITTKLDAIKADVTSVNNSVTNIPTTLDSKFSALTSKVDGVKADVAGVGSKVDAGVTTLGGKVDGVGTNVNAINQSVMQLSSGIDKLQWFPKQIKPVKYFERQSSAYESGKKTLLNVNGAGEIVAFCIDVPPVESTITLNIDGLEYALVGSNTEARQGWISLISLEDMSCILSDSGEYNYSATYAPRYYYIFPMDKDLSDGSTKKEAVLFENGELNLHHDAYFKANRMSEDEFKAKRTYSCDVDSYTILEKPLRFYRNFRLDADYGGFQYREYARVLYRLNE